MVLISRHFLRYSVHQMHSSLGSIAESVPNNIQKTLL